MSKHEQLATYLQNNRSKVSGVVDFDPGTDRLLQFDFTSNNTRLSGEDIADTLKFSAWVSQELRQSGCRYGIGGYMEHRTLYARSKLFDTGGAEPRRLHLGTDIWADASTPVYAPLAGHVHSFQDNNSFGDYGPTIILEHHLDGLLLYTLYGHLNRASLQDLSIGQVITQGQQLAQFGNITENGNWPPHLHFQLMFDMEGLAGDYPGVAPYSQTEHWRQNIADPNLILQFTAATII
ncbi:peptidoglycan DD-metalloendopeptidase family protein [Mucilaginibacter sp. PAMB04168]|uniref:peptidoglycan DD-metalloendopeptidase family protein n=1 Tax=Mucilaginibacter sp. PAMB04168 TaxID=3138567 RepID=UPI0031F6CE0D